MELKKTYKGFILWMAGFVAASVGIVFLPVSSVMMTRMVGNCCSLGITLLAFIIYKTEYVYWYNGTSYEDAVKAGTDRRKAYAWKHFTCFGIFSLAFLLFSIIMHLLNMSFWIDFWVLLVGIVAVAISTIRYKL